MDHSSGGHTGSGFITGLGVPIWTPELTPLSEAQYIGALFGLFLLSVGFRGLVAAQSYLDAFMQLRSLDEKSASVSKGGAITPSLVSTSPSPSIPEAKTALAVNTSQTTATATPETSSPSTSSPPTPQPPTPFYNAQARKQQRKLADAALRQGSNAPSTPSHQHQHEGQQQQQSFKTHWFTGLTLPTVKPFVWKVEVLRALLTTLVVGVGYMLMLVFMTYHSGYIGAILAGVFVGDIFFGRWAKARATPPQLLELHSKVEQRALQKQRRTEKEEAVERGEAMTSSRQHQHHQQQQQQQQPRHRLSTQSSVSSLDYQEAVLHASLHQHHHHDEMVC
ncbi:hypothetical protein BGZ73_003457 [Actinomortierella ambigua]|nr:hypothetical protein BGZ73_003457 [Actinomortierella ambigua]